MARRSVKNLSTTVVSAAVAFLALVALATAALIILGFRRTEATATQRSIDGFAAESRTSLVTYTSAEAALRMADLDRAVEILAQTGTTMVALRESILPVAWQSTRELERTPAGIIYDDNPARSTDIFIPAGGVSLSTDLDLRESSLLDKVFPQILPRYPDAVAVYYTGPGAVLRYHPPIDMHTVLDASYPLLTEPFYRLAAPADNPERNAVWTSPYRDPAGQGVLVTASVPLYAGDTFRGVLSMDIALDRLASSINTIRATPGGGAFLLDSSGTLIAASPAALQALAPATPGTPPLTDTFTLDLRTASPAAMQPIMQRMRAGETGSEALDLNGEAVVLSYAPLARTGWSLGLITPTREVSSQSAAVATAIQAGTGTTLRNALLVLGGLFILGVAASALLSRRIVRPLTALAAAVDGVAAGTLDTAIDVTRADEIGQLQSGFNQMTARLRANQQQVAEQTAALQTTLARQQALLETVQQLSVPLLPVLEGVVVLPLIGHLDVARVAELQPQVLTGVHERRVHTVILDLTGLLHGDGPAMDRLVQLIKGVQLLGARVLLAGMSAAMAQDLAGNTALPRDIAISQTLQQALEAVFRAARNGGAGDSRASAGSIPTAPGGARQRWR